MKTWCWHKWMILVGCICCAYASRMLVKLISWHSKHDHDASCRMKRWIAVTVLHRICQYDGSCLSTFIYTYSAFIIGNCHWLNCFVVGVSHKFLFPLSRHLSHCNCIWLSWWSWCHGLWKRSFLVGWCPQAISIIALRCPRQCINVIDSVNIKFWYMNLAQMPCSTKFRTIHTYLSIV